MKYGRKMCQNCVELKRANRALVEEIVNLRWMLFEVTYDIDTTPKPTMVKPPTPLKKPGEPETPPAS